MVAHDIAPAGRAPLRMVEPFVMLPKSLLYDLDVNPLAKVLYLIVGDQAWRDDTGTCALSHAELGALIDRTPRVVQDLLALLVERNLLGSYRYGPTQAKVYWLTAAPPAKLPGRHRQKIAGVSDDGPHTPAEFFRDTGRILPGHRQESAGTPIGKEIPETGPETGVVVADATAPPPPPIVQPTPDVVSEPPPARRRSRQPAVDTASAVPDTIRLSPVFMDWAASIGFTPDLVESEMERMLDHHKIAKKTSGNWSSSMRQWLKHEITYATRDGRQPGVHAAPRPGGGGDRAHFLDSRQPHRAARYQQQNRPGSTGKPGDPIDRDIAATADTWNDQKWWNIPGLPDLPDQDEPVQQDQP
jgi:hypothetical protein